MPRFNSENTPGVSETDLARLNAWFDTAAAGYKPLPTDVTGSKELFLDLLAKTILEDFTVQLKISEAFTTYKARGNREDLA